MSSSYNHPSSFNPYFPNHGNIVSRELASEETVDTELSLWSNAQFPLDVSSGLPEDCDPTSRRQVYRQPLNKPPPPPPPPHIMSAASGLTPFLSQVTVSNPGTTTTTTISPSPSSSQTSNVNNFSAIYPSPGSSQRTIPVHPSIMSEELLQRQLSNSQSIIINPATQQSTTSSPILPHPPTLDVASLQSGLLTPPMTMTGHQYYNYPHVMDSNYVCQLLAEEDKRRRNTAASARFRVKKKLREQTLERTSRDMSSKAELLESKVRELEREVKWLRSLIVEKDPRLLDIERPDKQQDESSAQGDQNK